MILAVHGGLPFGRSAAEISIFDKPLESNSGAAMALRLMQIFLPAGSDAPSEELLEEREILGRWRDDETDQTVLHLLVPAEETEPIMDRFEQRYAGAERFHMVLFPVEAVLPRPKAEPAPEEEHVEEQAAAEPAPPPPRISREEMYAEANDGIGVSRVFLGLSVLSAVVAAVGLSRNDTAVIIGAMVIAPLLGPNVALALASTLGDADLLRRAWASNLAGIASAFVFAIAIGAMFEIDANVPAIASRTDVSVGDVVLALAAGAAGTLAFTRGVVGAVIGVMVAVALMPPLVVCGMLLGTGKLDLSVGALLLFGANLICVNLAGVVTFLFQGVRPRTWWEAEVAKGRTRRAVLLWAGLLALLLVILWLERLDLHD
jgi:uncharacterized hydrophobic protein (TIGR00341 family)